MTFVIQAVGKSTPVSTTKKHITDGLKIHIQLCYTQRDTSWGGSTENVAPKNANKRQSHLTARRTTAKNLFDGD